MFSLLPPSCIGQPCVCGTARVFSLNIAPLPPSLPTLPTQVPLTAPRVEILDSDMLVLVPENGHALESLILLSISVIQKATFENSICLVWGRSLTF